MSAELDRARARGRTREDAQGGRPRAQPSSSVRTGRAAPALVEKIVVDYYGSEVPLQQLAGFQVPEARMLVINPYDKGSLGAIEKAIQHSDLGPQPEQRRPGHPAHLPAAHRRAAQGAREGREAHGRGGAGRRSATCAAPRATSSTSSRATPPRTTSPAPRRSSTSSPTPRRRRSTRLSSRRNRSCSRSDRRSASGPPPAHSRRKEVPHGPRTPIRPRRSERARQRGGSHHRRRGGRRGDGARRRRAAPRRPPARATATARRRARPTTAPDRCCGSPSARPPTPTDIGRGPVVRADLRARRAARTGRSRPPARCRRSCLITPPWSVTRLEDWTSFATSAPRWRDDAGRVSGDGYEDDIWSGEHRLGALDEGDRPTHDDFFSFADIDEPGSARALGVRRRRRRPRLRASPRPSGRTRPASSRSPIRTRSRPRVASPPASASAAPRVSHRAPRGRGGGGDGPRHRPGRRRRRRLPRARRDHVQDRPGRRAASSSPRSSAWPSPSSTACSARSATTRSRSSASPAASAW